MDRADDGQARRAPARRGSLRLRDQVGRHPRDPLLRARADADGGAPPHGHHLALSGAAAPGAAARLALGGARRRDRGVRRARPPELRAAPAPHASGGRQPHPAAGPGDPRHLRDLRPPLPGRPLLDAPALRGAPRAAGRARARGALVANPARPPRRGARTAPGERRAGARGRDRQANRLRLRAGPPQRCLDEGEEQAPPGARDRRLDARRGQARVEHRGPPRGLPRRRRRPALRGPGWKRLHGPPPRVPDEAPR